jgi:hypothetical protein
MWFSIFLAIVFLMVAVAVWFHGFWGALLAVFQVLFAGLIATGFYEPLATMLTNSNRELSYFWDIVALWGLFVISSILYRVFARFLSRYQVRFHYWVEMAGRSVAAVVVGYIFVMFTAFSVHLAPLQAEPFGSNLKPGSEGGVRPDLQWMSFVRGQSQMGLRAANVFDLDGKFVGRHYERRSNLETKESGFLSQ